MSRPRVAEWLEARGAHHDVVRWASGYGEDWQRLWNECPRGDWLLALAARLGVDRRSLVRAAAAAARTAVDSLPVDQSRPRAALALAEAWAAGEASAEACRAEAAELERACPSDPAGAAAVAACLSTLLAIDDAVVAAGAAASAAEAALCGVGDCALLSLLSYAQRQTAERVREHLPFERVAVALDSPGGGPPAAQ